MTCRFFFFQSYFQVVQPCTAKTRVDDLWRCSHRERLRVLSEKGREEPREREKDIRAEDEKDGEIEE